MCNRLSCITGLGAYTPRVGLGDRLGWVQSQLGMQDVWRILILRAPEILHSYDTTVRIIRLLYSKILDIFIVKEKARISIRWTVIPMPIVQLEYRSENTSLAAHVRVIQSH